MSIMTTPAPVSGRLDHLFLRWRAKLQLLIGQKDAAIQTFSQMQQRWPDDIYVLESLAHLAAVNGHHARAAGLLRRVTELQPERASAWFNLAYVLEQTGEAGQAETAFRRTLELDDKIDRAWYGLGLCLIQQRRLDEALKALERNTQMQPMSPYGWYQVARVQMDLGNRKEAARVIQHLEGFEPKVAAQLRRETGIHKPGSSQ